MSYLRSRIAAATVILIKRQQLKGRQARKILYRNEQRPLCQYCNRRLKDRLSWYVHMRSMHGMTMGLNGFQMDSQSLQFSDSNNSKAQPQENNSQSTSTNLQQAESQNWQLPSDMQEFYIEEVKPPTEPNIKHEATPRASNEEKSALAQLGVQIRALKVLIDEMPNVDEGIKALVCGVETSYSRVLEETPLEISAPVTVKNERM